MKTKLLYLMTAICCLALSACSGNKSSNEEATEQSSEVTAPIVPSYVGTYEGRIHLASPEAKADVLLTLREDHTYSLQMKVDGKDEIMEVKGTFLAIDAVDNVLALSATDVNGHVVEESSKVDYYKIFEDKLVACDAEGVLKEDANGGNYTLIKK